MAVAVGICNKIGVARHFVLETSAGAEVDLFWQHRWHVSVDLNHKDKSLATEGLASLGVDDTRPVMSFLTRNPEYLLRSGSVPNDRHDYRECRIKYYQKAIETCIAQGFQCVRVGRYNDDRIEKYIPHYVDYSHSAVRSDVMDLALAVRTDILVTCSSGLDSLYYLLGKPLVGVNVSNLDGRFSNYVTCLPKRMFVMDGSRRRELPVIAAVSKDFVVGPTHHTFKGTEVIFEENSPQEITEAVSFAIRLVQEDRYREECEAQAAPLWQEFNAMLPLSNLPIAHKQRFPSFGLPPSVIGRFLTA
jgi:putative glycosyltransferase (TIGR04372 family)